jgi:hypothetical protein
LETQSTPKLPEFQHVKGLVIGRFQKESRMTTDLLTKIIKSKEELSDIPVIADVDFGHTSPMIGVVLQLLSCRLVNKFILKNILPSTKIEFFRYNI